jgi:ribosomal protein L7/L12
LTRKYAIPTTEYTIDKTTKVQREKIVREALGLSTLDAAPPSEEAMALAQEYIDGKAEISEIKKRIVAYYAQNEHS